MPRNVRLLLVLLLVFGARSGAQTPPAPALQVEGGGWDFGRVDQSAWIEKDLVLENRSRRPIRITSLRQTCGCIEARLDEKVLMPGAKAALHLTLIAARGEGEIRKYVLIGSSDPVQPELQVPITGHIDPVWWLDLEGNEIDFGQVRNGDSVTKTFRLHVRKGFELGKVEALIHPSGSCLALEKREVEEPDGRRAWEFSLTLSGRMETGLLDGMVRFDTDFQAMPFRGYRIVADIVSSTEIRPTRLNLGRLEPGREWRGTIAIEKTLGSGLAITSLHCADPRVKLEKKVLREGRAYEVEVRLTPGADEAEIRGEIEIYLDEPGQRIVKIPYHGRLGD